MSERMVYERVRYCGNIDHHSKGHIYYQGAMGYCLVPIDPNPLDEIELLRDALDRETATDGEVIARGVGHLMESWELRAENSRLRGLLRRARQRISSRFGSGDEDLAQAIDAALDGECKHDGGWVLPILEGFVDKWRETPNEVGNLTGYRLQQVVCRLCGAPASEVQP